MTLVCQPRALSTAHGSQSVPAGVLGLMGVVVCCLAEVWDQVNSYTLCGPGVGFPWGPLTRLGT